MRNRILLLLCGITFGISAHADLPLRGFSDMSYIYDSNASNNSFQIHDVDFFISGSVDKKVSYVAEVNFQPTFEGVSTDIERSYIQYEINPWFKIAIGRFHTALGYWNDTYHHGSYLYTSVTRPLMERFEDSGGLLPVHNTGIEIRGKGAFHDGNIGYIFNIGNGRGPVKDPSTFFNSYSKSKSISASVFYEMDSGLRVGVNAWRSELPGGALMAADSTPATYTDSNGNTVQVTGPKGSEYIYGAHMVYNTPEIEWLTEYDLMLHHYYIGSSNADGSKDTTINLLYSQFGYHVNSVLTPFVRYEIDATSTADAYLNASPGYKATGLSGTLRQYIAGARYELSASSALKLEVTYLNSNAPLFITNSPNPTSNKTDWQSNLNWSFAW